MSELHIGVVRVGESWTIVGHSLRTRDYATRLAAVNAAHRFADSVIGRCVRLHVQDEFELQPGRLVG